MANTHPSLAIITTSPYQIALFLQPHLDLLPAEEQVVIYTNTTDQYRHLLPRLRHLDIQHTSITRAPRLTVKDIAATAQLATRLRRGRPRTVVTMSPKAGFVGQVAAYLARVPNRLHIFTGQVWDGMPIGVPRTAAMLADRTIAHLATDLAADSRSQAAHLAEEHILPTGSDVAVPNSAGSIRGVDLDRFRPDARVRAEVRRDLGISAEATCFIQVGRITAAKGVHDLLEAFGAVRTAWRRHETHREPSLLLVGEDESGLAAEFATRDGVSVLPFSHEPERLYAAADVTVLASHREGFPLCIIEGAACGTPAVGTDIAGTRDAITSSTGWLVPPKDPRRLSDALRFATDSPGQVRSKGATARERAAREYSSVDVSRNYAAYLLGIHRRAAAI